MKHFSRYTSADVLVSEGLPKALGRRRHRAAQQERQLSQEALSEDAPLLFQPVAQQGLIAARNKDTVYTLYRRSQLAIIKRGEFAAFAALCACAPHNTPKIHVNMLTRTHQNTLVSLCAAEAAKEG